MSAPLENVSKTLAKEKQEEEEEVTELFATKADLPCTFVSGNTIMKYGCNFICKLENTLFMR